MPRFTVIARGGLLGRNGITPQGAVVEMSDAHAASLPPGSVELAPDAPVLPPPAPAVVAPPVVHTEAPKARKAKS